MSDDTALVLTEHISAPPEVVFDYLVDPDKLIRWMGTEAKIDPRAGGTFWLNITGSDIATGEYLEVHRPSKVVFSWGWEGSTDVPPGSSTVTFTLTAEDGGTVVELVHAGLPGGADDPHEEGWAYHLPRLVAVAQGESVEPTVPH